MFRVGHNSLRLSVRVVPQGAMMLTDATAWDVSRAGTVCVRGASPFGPSVYVPGTSLRGVLRTFSERLLLGLGLRACDPLLPNACGKGRDAAPSRAYGESCFACRTFGSPQLAGRVVVSDLWPWDSAASEDDARAAWAEANRTERRGTMAVDRRARGGALGHEVECEVVTRGAFVGDVAIVNFQLWQAAMIGLALREIDHGYLTLGGGSGRGLGRVGCRVLAATLRNELPRAEGEDARRVRGVGTYMAADAGRWGVVVPDEAELPEDAEWSRAAIGLEANLGAKSWGRFLEQLLEGPWQKFIEAKRRRVREEEERAAQVGANDEHLGEEGDVGDGTASGEADTRSQEAEDAGPEMGTDGATTA